MPSGKAIGHRILIQRDHVLTTMLEGLGATVTEISEPFSPEPRRLRATATTATRCSTDDARPQRCRAC